MPRAVICDELSGPESLHFREVAPLAPPGPGEVAIAVKAAGLNFPDLLMTRGRYQFKPPLPFVPGFDVAGVVTATGAGVTRCRTGDAVIALLPFHGAFADEAVVSQERIFALPQSFSYAEGACFHVATATATNALLQRGAVQPGDIVLIHGAGGGVGLAGVEVAKLLGAIVIAVAGAEDKLTIARSRGADHLIDHRTEDFQRRALEITGGRGVDVVLDPVGGDTFDASLRCTAWAGRLLVVGFAAGRIQSIPGNQPLLKGLSIIGVRALEDATRRPEIGAAYQRWMYGHAAEGRLRPHISHSYPLEQFQDALATLQGRHAIGRVALTME
jgi:NADPH:quinone reductase